MIQRTLVLVRATGMKHCVSLGVADTWSDAKSMEVLVPELRRIHEVRRGDKFILQPIDPTKD